VAHPVRFGSDIDPLDSHVRFTPESGHQSAKRFNELPKLDHFLRPAAMPVIAIRPAFRRATARAVHAAHPPASDRRRATGLPSPFRSGNAPRGLVSLVVAHFAFDPPPSTGTVSFWVGSMIFIGLSVQAVSNLVAMVSFRLSVTI